MAGDDQDYRSYTQYYENDVGEGDGSYQGGIGGYDTGGHATGGNGYAAYGTYQSSEFVPGTQVGQYADEYTGGDYYTAPNSGTGLREIGLSSIHQNASFGYDGISKVCFDSMEESIWVGSINGMIYQYIKSTMEYYSSIAAHMDGPVLCMESLGSSVASLSGEQFCVHTSGCGPRLSYLDNHGDMASFVYQKWNHKSLIGRHGGGVFLYDVVKERLGGTCPTPHGVIALSGPLSRGQIAAASPDGYLSLLDTRQGSISGNGTVADTKLYSHGFASMDSSDSLLVTAGYGGRADRPTLEPVVRVFDVRMGLRMLMALPCSNGPAVLKFHPRLASSVLICSATGMFSIMETSASAAAYDGHFVDMGGDTVASCDMSSTGHCIVFGGTNGYLHLWSAQDQPAFSQGCVVPEYASDNPHNSGIHMGDETSFSVAPMYLPPDGEYASNIGEEEVMSVGLPPRVADSALMATGKISDFVTYIQNPKYDKENAPGASAAAVHALRNKRVQHKRSGKETEAAIDERAQRRAKEGEIVLPKKFRRAFIKHQTGVKFEEFDFKLFNKTPFSGLENNLANCYTNALVQVLYFTRPLRDLLVKHMPDVEDEFSLLGEMSLLFRMLDTADGEVCQAANLLRALRQTSEAVGLGILEGVKGERGAVDIAVEAQKDKSIVRRIERLNRFILTRMDKEEKQSQKPSASGASIEEIFAVHKRQKTTCLTRKELEPKEQMVQTYQVDLRYPSTFKNQDNSVVQFSELLRSSLGAVSEMKAWFDDSVRYQPVRQERMPVSLPEVMVCYTGLEDRSLIKYWDSRHGQEFPFAVSVTYDPTGGSVSCEQGRSVEDLQRKLEHVPEGSQRSIYLLTGVVSYIYDQDEAEEIGSYEGHLLAHVNVPPAYRQGKASRHIGRSSEPTLGSQLKWMTFNDFYITESSLHEVEDIYEGQKIPVLLYFTKLDYLDTNMGKELPQAAPALTDGEFFYLCRSPPIQGHHSNLEQSKFVPLNEEELPLAGKIFALDAEFVAYSAPEKRVLSDQDDISRTSRLGLGRVSVVRGYGQLMALPCIDDYIRSVEPIYDYLTKYSGLVQGDLDPETSMRHLTTLRKAYLKLRYMIDSGCVFVGHGLKKDFRMLNIVVPTDQVIDTVDLYHSGRGRRLSLKFLSAYFLGNEIQGATHDSIEDATTALQLYRVYQELNGRGAFRQALQRAYDWGAANGWDPQFWGDRKPPPIELGTPKDG